MDAIEIAGVSKTFGRGSRAVAALDGLSLAIPQGRVYGLLGPNGAGKSTLLRIIAGLIRADRGGIRLFGEPAGSAARSRVGMLIEAPAFYPFLTAREHLAMLADLAAKPADPGEALSRVGLAGAAGRKVGAFSLGMKQRLGIACALVSRPEAVILDEPTNGLDPDGMLEVRALIMELAARDGITVLLSSHLLDEVERICHRVAILRGGRLAAEGEVTGLLGREERFWIDIDPPGLLLERFGAQAEAGDGGIYLRIGPEQVPDLIAALAAAGGRIREAKWVRPKLEDVFLAETRGEPA